MEAVAFAPRVLPHNGPLSYAVLRFYGEDVGRMAHEKHLNHPAFGIGTFAYVSGLNDSLGWAEAGFMHKAAKVVRTSLAVPAQLVVWAPVACFACTKGAAITACSGLNAGRQASLHGFLPLLAMALLLEVSATAYIGFLAGKAISRAACRLLI